MDIEYWMEIGMRWNQIIKAIRGSRKQLTIKFDEAGEVVVIEIGNDVFGVWDIPTLDQLESILLKAL